MKNEIKHPSPLKLGLLIGALYLVLSLGLSLLPKTIFDDLEKNTWLSYKLLMILLILCIVSIPLIKIYYKYYSQKSDNFPKLKYIYPVFWDKQGNPYCPSCKKPMNRFSKIRLICTDRENCKSDIILKNIKGETYSIDDIVDNIKQLWKKHK